LAGRGGATACKKTDWVEGGLLIGENLGRGVSIPTKERHRGRLIKGGEKLRSAHSTAVISTSKKQRGETNWGDEGEKEFAQDCEHKRQWGGREVVVIFALVIRKGKKRNSNALAKGGRNHEIRGK